MFDFIKRFASRIESEILLFTLAIATLLVSAFMDPPDHHSQATIVLLGCVTALALVAIASYSLRSRTGLRLDVASKESMSSPGDDLLSLESMIQRLRDDADGRRLKVTRKFLILASFLYAFFHVLDRVVLSSGSIESAFKIRMAVCVLILCVWASSYSKWFRRHESMVVGIAGLLAGAGILAIMAQDGERASYYHEGLSLVILFLGFVFQIRTRVVAAVSVALILGYTAFLAIESSKPAVVAMNEYFFMVSAMSFAVFAGHSIRQLNNTLIEKSAELALVSRPGSRHSQPLAVRASELGDRIKHLESGQPNILPEDLSVLSSDAQALADQVAELVARRGA